MTGPPARGWGRVATGAALAVLAAASLAIAAGPDREKSDWAVGEPVAIAVREGRARFRCPTPKPGSRVVVIVSAIARGDGPFPIRLDARPAERGEKPDRAEEGPRKTPVVAGAPIEAPKPAPKTNPAAARTFSLMSREGDVASASNYTTIQARLRAVGRRVQVYVDPDDDGVVGANLLRDIVATCDDRVIPGAETLWGSARDVDGDGRLTILLSGKLGRLGGGRLAADGFVRGADFDTGFASPFGNRCDMIYLNAALAPGPYLRTLLAHEYTHAVTISRKVFAADGRRVGAEEEGWLDEAMAHLAEDMHGFSRANLEHRIAAFLADPGRYRLVVEDYYTTNLFRSHGHRGATYLFLRWCVDQHGPGLLSTLIRSPRRGIDGLEAATGSTFADLYRRWTVSLAVSGLEPAELASKFSETIPRTSWVDPGSSESWTSPGTATHYAIIGGDSGKAVEVEVTGPPGADLQVTAIPLPDDLPRLRLSARSLPAEEGRAAQVVLRVRQEIGAGSRLHALSWAPLVPPPATPGPSTRGGRLESAGLASAVGGAEFGPGVTRLSRPIGLLNLPIGAAPVVLKIIAADHSGRRVAAWAIVEEDGEPSS